MPSHLLVRNIMLLFCFISLAACIPGQETALPAIPPSQQEATAPVPSTKGTILVTYIKDGNIYVWDSAINQSRAIVSSGDVKDVKISDDGQVIAFVRLSRILQNESGVAEFALWAVSQNGENGRELVAGEVLRQRLHAAPGDSTGIAEMDWLSRTHRLIYSGMKGNAAGPDVRQAEDVYLVDADTLSDTLLAPAGTGVRVSGIPDGQQFVSSPDGTQIALLSGTELSFVNVDGSHLRQAVLTYPQSGAGDVPFVPTGVWTQDSGALIVNAPVDSDPSQGINFSITRVPVDGSPAEVIATALNGFPISLTFSPDGKRVAFRSERDSKLIWPIVPLAVDLGSLTIPDEYALDYVNLHWSPAGDAYLIDQRNLWQLCPNAAESSDFCGNAVEVGNRITAIRWIDSTRFLFLTDGPSVLFLGSMDGTSTPIVTWPLEEYNHRFSVALLP